MITATLHLFGYFVSGPKSSEFVPGGETADVEAVIERLSLAEDYDKDDYTSTALYAKGFQFSTKGPEEMFEFLRLKKKLGLTWEDVFKGTEKASVLTTLDAQMHQHQLKDSD